MPLAEMITLGMCSLASAFDSSAVRTRRATEHMPRVSATLRRCIARYLR